MAGAPRPFDLHPGTPHTPEAFDRFGCTSCHGGQGLATTQADAHGTAADAGPPMTPPASIEAGCGRCHVSESVAGAPVLSRGRALIARAGCYACHAVRGQDTFRSEAPPLATLPLKTGGEWLKRWLKDPKSIDPNATMPNFHLTDQAIDELSHFLFAAQVPKELAGRIEAAAAEPPGSSANGKKLVSESRCITCHTVEGKGKGLGARALEDRLHRVARLAARVPARTAGLQPAHPDAALSLQRGRVARHRRLSGG